MKNMNILDLSEKEPSTDATEDYSPEKRCLSRSSSDKSEKSMSDEKYAQKKEKRKLILSTIKNKVKIKNILEHSIDQCPDTGDQTIFGDVYKIKGLLGVGGFGVVLAVENKETGNLNAIKIWLKLNHAKIINEEANVLSELDHPNIIKVSKFYETKSRCLMEMEF
jgi:hypothetical protein